MIPLSVNSFLVLKDSCQLVPISPYVMSRLLLNIVGLLEFEEDLCRYCDNSNRAYYTATSYLTLNFLREHFLLEFPTYLDQKLLVYSHFSVTLKWQLCMPTGNDTDEWNVFRRLTNLIACIVS